MGGRHRLGARHARGGARVRAGAARRSTARRNRRGARAVPGPAAGRGVGARVEPSAPSRRPPDRRRRAGLGPSRHGGAHRRARDRDAAPRRSGRMAGELGPHDPERRPRGGGLGELLGLAHLREAPPMRRRIAIVGALALALLMANTAAAHDAPYSFLDLRLGPHGIAGTLTAHAYDLAHEIGLATPDSLLDSLRAAAEAPRLADRLGSRLALQADGHAIVARWSGVEVNRARHGLTLHFESTWQRLPGALDLEAHLFPYDPQHETYVNLYEGDSLRLQSLLDRRHDRTRLYTGTRQGRWAVVVTFVAAGIQHIFLGPDHILFVIALLLLGGGIARLLKIVTAFTVAHSITLALATLRIVDPPARVIEPLIALSIVLVGLENLRAGPRRDHRAALAFLFGLVHGFGFAGVLREFGLPSAALGWSLFSFNLGVEVGQACIVASVAPLLGLMRGRSPSLAVRVVRYGSCAVMLAGAYWLGERLLLAARG